MIEILAEALVLEAAEKAGGTGGAWASLADVRALCPMSREDFTAAARRLAHKGTVVLVPEDNQKTLTSEDHRAAVVFGEVCHLITVE